MIERCATFANVIVLVLLISFKINILNQLFNAIITLTGARTFPAQSFPPDGTTFSQIVLGQRLSKEIPPYGYWNMQFYQSEAAYIQFDYNIPRGASIGVYARRNALPTHTQYHILEVLSGYKARTTRASHVSGSRKLPNPRILIPYYFSSLL